MKPIILISLLVAFLLGGSYLPNQDFNHRLRSIVSPHLFSLVGWELKVIPQEASCWLLDRQNKADNEVPVVTEYFDYTEQIKTIKSKIEATKVNSGESDLASLEAELNRLQARKIALTVRVERVLEAQIKETLAEQGIFNPLVGLKVGFPPFNFKLTDSPNLLVVSPREKIESIQEITLKPSLSFKEMENIEAKVDELSVSSLVVELGGLGATYPTLVTNEAGLPFTLDTAIEEWLHQYLLFKPLGFLYLLDVTGLSRNYEIATMNETLASMVSKEIGAIVYQKYYPEYRDSLNQSQRLKTGFDFNQEMREIRKTVDVYLAQGQIKLAEEFMKRKRQYLAEKGYHLRKLNQAYFAFYGTYADSPTSISPIGQELEKLRSQSTSLRDFLNTVAAMTSRQQLQDRLTEIQSKTIRP